MPDYLTIYTCLSIYVVGLLVFTEVYTQPLNFCKEHKQLNNKQLKKYKQMKTPSLLLFVLAIPFFACQPGAERAAEDYPEGSLFIIGGGSRPPEMAERMIDEAGIWEEGYLVILPMSSSVPDSAIIWASEQFIDQGITNIAGFNFLPGEEPPAEWVDSVRNAPLIYISGGDQNRFMEIVHDSPVMEAIHEAYANGALIAGTSAGAAVMSEKMITGDELRYPEYRPTFPVIEAENLDMAEGLGLLTTAVIDQHFVWRSRHNRLITSVLEYPELPGIGIDESTAILVKGNTAEVVGEAQVLVFRNTLKSKSKHNNKLGAHGLLLDVFLPGEKFFITKEND